MSARTRHQSDVLSPHLGGATGRSIGATKPGGFWLPGTVTGQTRTFHCEGCRTHPAPDCAACGAPTVVRLRGKLDEHILTLCLRCWRTLLAVRSQSTAEKRLYDERRAAKRKTREPVEVERERRTA